MRDDRKGREAFVLFCFGRSQFMGDHITKQGLGKEESLQMDSKFDSGSKHKTG